MKLQEAKILYYRTCLSIAGVPDAWEADGANAWFMYEALNHNKFVSFDMWCYRCSLEIEAPEDTAAKQGQAAVVALGGNSAPKPPGGKKINPNDSIVVEDNPSASEIDQARAACAAELTKV